MVERAEIKERFRAFENKAGNKIFKISDPHIRPFFERFSIIKQILFKPKWSEGPSTDAAVSLMMVDIDVELMFIKSQLT